MKELGIAGKISDLRHQMGITQDELANALGVTKASVSKWETNLSYPDILLLPRIASFFNISIDELMNYTPLLAKEEISAIYLSFAKRFATEDFNVVYSDCEKTIKKYFSCFPFLMQMSILFLNHFNLAPSMEQSLLILEEIKQLNRRIQTYSEDAALRSDACVLEATACLMLCNLYAAAQKDAEKQTQLSQVFALLGTQIKPPMSGNKIIITAYELQGDLDKAKQLAQIDVYNILMMLLSSLPQLLSLYANDDNKAEEIIARSLSVLDTFQIDLLNPNSAAILYYQIACIRMQNGNHKGALEMLERYVDACLNVLEKCFLHGDMFFDRIKEWFEEFNLGTNAPRNTALIYASALSGLTDTPGFAPLKEEPQFERLLEKLKSYEKRGEKC